MAPATLLAHAKLVRSEPANGSKVAASPSRIVLVFTEVPALALSSVRLIGPGGDTLRLRNLSHHVRNEHILNAEIDNPLASGRYQVLWRVAASDGHPTSGSIQFDITAADASTAPVTQSVDSTAPASMPDVETIAIGGALGAIVARWLSFIAILVIIGAVVFHYVVLPRTNESNETFLHIAATNTATLGLFASAAGLLAAMLKLVRESADMPDATLNSLLFGSLWGFALLLQVLGCIVALVAFALVHKAGKADRSGAWRASFVAAAILAVSPSLGGHAAASDHALISVPIDVVHVVAASMWLGTLTTILVAGIPATFKTPDDKSPSGRVAAMINVFSPLALSCGGAVVATGIGSSVLRLPSLDAVWMSPYGTALMFKLVLVAILFAAGAFNWRRMRPRLSGDYAVAQLRSSVRFELVLGLAVLAVTAILVALELP